MVERLLHSPAGVWDEGLEFREPAAERRIGRLVCNNEGRSVGTLIGLVVCDNEGRSVGALIGLVGCDNEGRSVGALNGRVVCVTVTDVLLVLSSVLYCSVSERGVFLAVARSSWTFFR